MVLRGTTLVAWGAVLLLVPRASVQAQDQISGKFYRYDVVGRAGLGDVSGILGAGPSINNNGQVAFGGQSIGLNALYVADLGVTVPRRIATQSAFSFLRGIMINDNQHLVAVNQDSAPVPPSTRPRASGPS